MGLATSLASLAEGLTIFRSADQGKLKLQLALVQS
jgi:hypothetical protein